MTTEEEGQKQKREAHETTGSADTGTVKTKGKQTMVRRQEQNGTNTQVTNYYSKEVRTDDKRTDGKKDEVESED